MSFLYAFLIAGAICALTQLLSETKAPFPLIAIALMTLGGGLLTKFGIIDALNALGAGGLAVTALGCGNGAYNAGIALKMSGNVMPLILTLLLNVILVAMGALCGSKLLEKFPECFEKQN